VEGIVDVEITVSAKVILALGASASSAWVAA
jgi:hypothetical protein